jgi:hypothetical protein
VGARIALSIQEGRFAEAERLTQELLASEQTIASLAEAFVQQAANDATGGRACHDWLASLVMKRYTTWS